MEFDPQLQVIRVYRQMLDPVWAGSIGLSPEILTKIQKYLSKFDAFEREILREDAESIPEKLKLFMKEVFKDLEQEISAENHQKSMAQTERAPQPVQIETPKLRVRSIMSDLFHKLKRLIHKESHKLTSENFETKDLLPEDKFQGLKSNTIKILRLLDISDFKNRKGYKRLKKLLVDYMTGDTTERPRLRRKNCLIEFKRLLLKELELNG